MSSKQDIRKAWVQARLSAGAADTPQQKAKLRAQFNKLSQTKEGRTKIAQAVLPSGSAAERLKLKQTIKPVAVTSSASGGSSGDASTPLGPVLGPPYPGKNYSAGARVPRSSGPASGKSPTKSPTESPTESPTPYVGPRAGGAAGGTPGSGGFSWNDSTKYIPAVRNLDELANAARQGDVWGVVGNTWNTAAEAAMVYGAVRRANPAAIVAIAKSPQGTKALTGAVLKGTGRALNPKQVFLDWVNPFRQFGNPLSPIKGWFGKGKGNVPVTPPSGPVTPPVNVRGGVPEGWPNKYNPNVPWTGTQPTPNLYLPKAGGGKPVPSSGVRGGVPQGWPSGETQTVKPVGPKGGKGRGSKKGIK